jgi:GntR family transcriptional regulator
VPGDRLPRENELAEMLGVSRMTLRQSLSALESRGVLVRRTGRAGGTYVSEPRIEADLSGLAGFTEQMRRASVRAGARMVSAQTIPAGAAAARGLGIAVGVAVHEIVRVRTARRKPLVLERSYFPVTVYPDLLEQPLTGSLYELLRRRYRHVPHTATEALEPVMADAEQARLLGVDEGVPLMLIERTTYSAAGLAIEYARDLYRPDRVRITLRTGVGVGERRADLTGSLED